MDEILPSLFLGNADAAKNKKKLHSLGITHILNCTKEIPNFFPQEFDYFKLNIRDTPREKISEYFFYSYEFIDHAIKSKGKVLVHCNAGMSRSPTIVINYIMKRYNLSLPIAFNFVQKNHVESRPNEGFIKQLNKCHERKKIYKENKLLSVMTTPFNWSYHNIHNQKNGCRA